MSERRALGEMVFSQNDAEYDVNGVCEQCLFVKLQRVHVLHRKRLEAKHGFEFSVFIVHTTNSFIILYITLQAVFALFTLH